MWLPQAVADDQRCQGWWAGQAGAAAPLVQAMRWCCAKQTPSEAMGCAGETAPASSELQESCNACRPLTSPHTSNSSAHHVAGHSGQPRKANMEVADELQASTSGAQSASASPAGFPVRTKLFTRDIDGVATTFSYSMYMDQTLMFVTQTGTAGTMIAATQDAAFDGSTTYSTAVVLGKRDEPLLQLCARQIVELAGAAGYKKPMLIGLGFKQHSMQLVKQVMQAISTDNVWS